jgi:hypothetical protein
VPQQRQSARLTQILQLRVRDFGEFVLTGKRFAEIGMTDWHIFAKESDAVTDRAHAVLVNA